MHQVLPDSVWHQVHPVVVLRDGMVQFDPSPTVIEQSWQFVRILRVFMAL